MTSQGNSNKSYLKPASLKQRKHKVLVVKELIWPPNSVKEFMYFILQLLKKNTQIGYLFVPTIYAILGVILSYISESIFMRLQKTLGINTDGFYIFVNGLLLVAVIFTSIVWWFFQVKIKKYSYRTFVFITYLNYVCISLVIPILTFRTLIVMFTRTTAIKWSLGYVPLILINLFIAYLISVVLKSISLFKTKIWIAIITIIILLLTMIYCNWAVLFSLSHSLL